MKLKKFIALIIGKILYRATFHLHLGGGSAAPGLYALKIYPHLITDLSSKIPYTIIITGTNGKTTTARLLAHMAKKAKLKVLRNNTGSNLERGIASALIRAYLFRDIILRRSIGTRYDLAIWELDEAAFVKLAPALKPDTIIFLNVFRDQLDRYGEVDSVVKKWCQTLENINPQATLLINGDDKTLLNLERCFRGKTEYFGIVGQKVSGEKTVGDVMDRKLSVWAQNASSRGLEGTLFEAMIGEDLQPVWLPLPGIYNIYNFLGSLAALDKIGIDLKEAIRSLTDFSPAFGRVEKFTIDQKIGFILLIKNPAGANQVLHTLHNQLKPEDTLLIALNDNFADGKDVSWIWDVNFEKSALIKYQTIASGSRASDLALRLKYAGAKETNLQVEPDLEKAFQKGRQGEGRLFILPTYTALLEFQRLLTNFGIKKHYWHDK